MAYVITCGDEGVQVNVGTRLAFAGAGVKLVGFEAVVPLLTKLFGQELYLACNEESEWVKAANDLVNWEQVNAFAQQQTQALADVVGIPYVGYLPFADPRELEKGVKGHMVRPHGIHIANKISLTLAGGEQKFHLGHYVISADWVHLAKPGLIKQVIEPQIAFYRKLAKGQNLPLVFELEGELGEAVAQKNQAALQATGIA